METDISQKIELFSAGKEKLSLNHALEAHARLKECHQDLARRQSRYESLYGYYLGVFFLACLGFFTLYNRSIFEFPLISIVLSGVGCLLALMLRLLPADLQSRAEATDCIKQGREIEISFEYVIAYTYFKTYEKYERSLYWCYLVSRLLPMGVIGISTAIAGTLLALEVGTWLAVIVAIFSAITLFVGGFFYVLVVRKVCLLKNV